MNDYCYEKFTNDSSDDFPKYSDGLGESMKEVRDENHNEDQLFVSQSADDWYYKNVYDRLADLPKELPDDIYEDMLIASANKEDRFKRALLNVLELAKANIRDNYGPEMPPYDDGGMAMKVTARSDETTARESVKIIESNLR